jgi:hypothetical protein
MGLAPPTPLGIREDLLGQGLGLLLIGQLAALFSAQGQFLILFALVVLLRRPAPAIAVAYATQVLMVLSTGSMTGFARSFGLLPLSVLVAMTSLALSYLVLLRFGFLAHVVGLLAAALLSNSPLTTDLTAWYAGSGSVCALTLAGLAVYGFIVSTGGQSLFGGWLFGDE